MKKLGKCIRDGTAVHVSRELFECKSRICRERVRHGGRVFCRIPIAEKITKEKGLRRLEDEP
jgi:hypothetical protein